MKRVDTVWLEVISELLINLAAGWFGASFIVPAISEKPITFNLSILTMDIVMGIVFLATSYKLKKLAKNKRRR